MDPRLVRLTAKATAAQWSADQIDWRLEPVLPARVPRGVYIDLVSQLYYGEQAALAALDRLVVELPEPEAKAFLATQITDEQRHADVYRGYLERLGDIAPPNAALAQLFAYARGSTASAIAGVVALNLVMEHEALAQQQQRIDTLPCPLFGAINRAIVADESRHAGFGVIYLARVLPSVPRAERLALVTWIRTLWGMWCGANEGRYANDGGELLRLERAELARRWALLAARLARLGLATPAELGA